MKVVVTAPLVHRCPHVDELDVGRVELTFAAEAPELHGLRRTLESFAKLKATHEQVTGWVADAYPLAEVRTFWTTAGMEVEVQS